MKTKLKVSLIPCGSLLRTWSNSETLVTFKADGIPKVRQRAVAPPPPPPLLYAWNIQVSWVISILIISYVAATNGQSWRSLTMIHVDQLTTTYRNNIPYDRNQIKHIFMLRHRGKSVETKKYAWGYGAFESQVRMVWKQQRNVKTLPIN